TTASRPSCEPARTYTSWPTCSSAWPKPAPAKSTRAPPHSSTLQGRRLTRAENRKRTHASGHPGGRGVACWSLGLGGLPSAYAPAGTGRVCFLRRTARAVPRPSCWPHLLGKETRPMSTTHPPLASAPDQIGATTTLAVSYLRVSTKEQASKGGQ